MAIPELIDCFEFNSIYIDYKERLEVKGQNSETYNLNNFVVDVHVMGQPV